MSDKTKLRICLSPLKLLLVLAIGCTTAGRDHPSDVELAVEFAIGPMWPSELNKTAVVRGGKRWFREGDDGENWQEFVEVGTHERGGDSECGATTRVGRKRLRAWLEQECADVEWNLIKEDENSVLWEWWNPHGCLGLGAQHEMVKGIFGRCGCVAVHYTAKGGQLAPDRRAEWVDRLSKWELFVTKPNSSKESLQLAENCQARWANKEPLGEDCFEEVANTERLQDLAVVALGKEGCLP